MSRGQDWAAGWRELNLAGMPRRVVVAGRVVVGVPADQREFSWQDPPEVGVIFESRVRSPPGDVLKKDSCGASFHGDVGKVAQFVDRMS